jgi:hypothetical protein
MLLHSKIALQYGTDLQCNPAVFIFFWSSDCEDMKKHTMQHTFITITTTTIIIIIIIIIILNWIIIIIIVFLR